MAGSARDLLTAMGWRNRKGVQARRKNHLAMAGATEHDDPVALQCAIRRREFWTAAKCGAPQAADWLRKKKFNPDTAEGRAEILRELRIPTRDRALFFRILLDATQRP